MALNFFAAFLLAILGAILASFAGVVSARFHTGQPIARGRSRCDACGKILSPLALVPIVSYVFSKGRARCCGTVLSPFSPISESVLGALFVLAYLRIGLTLALVIFLVALSLLFVLVLYDLAHQILPTSLLVLFVVASTAYGFVSAGSPVSFGASVLVGLILAAILLGIHYLSKGRAMGFSDAPLVYGLSLLVGPSAIAGFLFSFWIGAAIGIIVLAQRPKGSRMGVEVPFAPFLAAGFLLAFFSQWDPFAFASFLLR